MILSAMFIILGLFTGLSQIIFSPQQRLAKFLCFMAGALFGMGAIQLLLALLEASA